MNNHGSIYRLNSSYINILPNSFFPFGRLSIDNENSEEINNDDDIFQEDDYYNYNELINHYSYRQWMSYDEIFEGINRIISSEK